MVNLKLLKRLENKKSLSIAYIIAICIGVTYIEFGRKSGLITDDLVLIQMFPNFSIALIATYIAAVGYYLLPTAYVANVVNVIEFSDYRGWSKFWKMVKVSIFYIFLLVPCLIIVGDLSLEEVNRSQEFLELLGVYGLILPALAYCIGDASNTKTSYIKLFKELEDKKERKISELVDALKLQDDEIDKLDEKVKCLSEEIERKTNENVHLKIEIARLKEQLKEYQQYSTLIDGSKLLIKIFKKK